MRLALLALACNLIFGCEKQGEPQCPADFYFDEADQKCHLAVKPNPDAEVDPLAARAVTKSGTRLKMRIGRTPDGAAEHRGWRDTLLSVNCTFLPSDDGLRCLPTGEPVSVITAGGHTLYGDSACGNRLAWTSAALVFWAYEPIPGSSAFRGVRVGGPASPSQVYCQPRGTNMCLPVIGLLCQGDAVPVSGFREMRLEAPSTFVLMTESAE